MLTLPRLLPWQHLGLIQNADVNSRYHQHHHVHSTIHHSFIPTLTAVIIIHTILVAGCSFFLGMRGLGVSCFA